jgi:hypothetical protein
MCEVLHIEQSSIVHLHKCNYMPPSVLTSTYTFPSGPDLAAIWESNRSDLAQDMTEYQKGQTL